MKPLNLSVFISSRNNDHFIVDGNTCASLSEIRLFLQNELEDQKLFGKSFLTVRINESFAADTTEDSYNACLKEVQDSDFIIALYNGYSGWAPEGNTMGICHAELEAALQVSSKKTAILDISSFFTIKAQDEAEEIRNDIFAKYVRNLNRFSNPLKLTKANRNCDGLKLTLLKSIQELISNHLAKRVENSNYYYNLSQSNETALVWKKLNYEPRAKLIKEKLTEMVNNSVYLKNSIKPTHAIPDKMSVEDAKSYAGRPFLSDQDLVKSSANNTGETGPVHFIAVYDTATEAQVKGVIGHPDISVIKEDFGFYLWDQKMHVQLIFLTECNTPAAIQTKYLLFENWANSTGEMDRIANRAGARYLILRSIKEARVIANRK